MLSAGTKRPSGADSPAPKRFNNTIETSRSSCFVLSDSICFGTLCNVPVSVRHDPALSSQPSEPLSPENRPYLVLQYSFTGEYCWLNIPGQESFGCFNSRYSKAIKRLSSDSCVQIDPLVHIDGLRKARSSWKHRGNAATLDLEINIYGHSHCSAEVSEKLYSLKLFLQAPSVDLRCRVYDNPQYLKLPDVGDSDIEVLPDNEIVSKPMAPLVEARLSELETIFDHLPQPGFLREVVTDGRLITPLMKHQKEAVDFITRRETGNLPPSLSLWKLDSAEIGLFCYRHVITRSKNSRMDDITGGILADDMGLGKTLSILAIIVASLGAALNYATINTSRTTVATKATLVIVPSALLLDSWTEEIQRHVLPGTVHVHRYHALGKKIDMLSLLKCDIVLTTYMTITAQFCRERSMIDQIDWYRIVLDEAHTIRNSSTKQFRAMSALRSHIRWCLTGTPVQNGLEDFGSLVKFLRVPALEDAANFRKYVTTPALQGGSDRFANLRRLLESICLRRTKVLLHLPEPVTDTKLLQLCESEKEAYRGFNSSLKRAVDLAVSGRSMRKANQHMIEAILRMRLFCNNGLSALSGRSAGLGLPSDAEEALSYLQTSGQATCIRCQCDILSVYQDGDTSSGILTSCFHLLCGECLPSYIQDLEASTQSERSQCPECGHQGDPHSFIVDYSKPLNSNESPIMPNSTKLRAILEVIAAQSKNDKSVIFSFWKKTLDHIASMFHTNGIPHYRIHGSLPSNKRAKVLQDFESSTSVNVLLITFGTGAVGINKLVVANRIHIVEPQWNPSVESQAIGRVLRPGQEKEVTVIRYIMQGTVEEAVQDRQLRKLQLARGGFALSKDEHTFQRIQEIMDLLCPLKKSCASPT